jgi:hypothetical protein
MFPFKMAYFLPELSVSRIALVPLLFASWINPKNLFPVTEYGACSTLLFPEDFPLPLYADTLFV